MTTPRDRAREARDTDSDALKLAQVYVDASDTMSLAREVLGAPHAEYWSASAAESLAREVVRLHECDDEWRERLMHALRHIREMECERDHDEHMEPCPRRTAKEAIDNRDCSICAAAQVATPARPAASRAEPARLDAERTEEHISGAEFVAEARRLGLEPELPDDDLADRVMRENRPASTVSWCISVCHRRDGHVKHIAGNGGWCTKCSKPYGLAAEAPPSVSPGVRHLRGRGANMSKPDFDAMSREFVNTTTGSMTSALSALLRSVHASRDAEVKAAREQGIREAAERSGSGLFLTPAENLAIRDRILALLNAPKGG